MQKKIHLISFDVPFPTNYGGVIDVFYKIKALHSLGVKIVLHCFQHNKSSQPILNQFCESVHYYERNSFFKSLLSNEIPFIAKSRGNEALIHSITVDNAPILFDGLHTTYILKLHDFKERKLFLRAHNIEHRFYKGLANSESNIFKKNFFKQEAKKLKRYEKILKNIDGVFTISPFEQKYFQEKYGSKCHYIPAFYDDEIHTKHQIDYKKILYHGNISVSENVKAALYLIDIYKDSSNTLIIASNYSNKEINVEIEKYSNIQFIHLTKQEELYQLFEEAHINVLPTFQKTGIKLKLLNTLNQGKFIIANDFMIEDTGLESLCERANTKDEFLSKTKELLEKDFTSKIIQDRQKVLKSISPEKGAQKIIDTIFN